MKYLLACGLIALAVLAARKGQDDSARPKNLSAGESRKFPSVQVCDPDEEPDPNDPTGGQG